MVEDDRPHAELVDALVQTAFSTMAVLSRIAAENELSLTQLRVLGILRGRRVRISELADHLGLEKSTLSGLVDRAQRRGLIERKPSTSDGRVVEVMLSSDGVAQADVVGGRVAQALAAQTSQLSPGEQARLAVLLERLLGGAGEPEKAVPR